MTDARLYRILDANFNRSREGLRVAEEVVRFAVDSAALQKSFKRCRHDIQRVLEGFAISPRELVRSREARGDVGRKPSFLEDRRRDLASVFLANVQRVKESLRALEEFSKLIDPKASRCLKEIRFRVYVLEKRALPKMESLRDHLSRKLLKPGQRGAGGSRPARRRQRRSASR